MNRRWPRAWGDTFSIGQGHPVKCIPVASTPYRRRKNRLLELDGHSRYGSTHKRPRLESARPWTPDPETRRPQAQDGTGQTRQIDGRLDSRLMGLADGFLAAPETFLLAHPRHSTRQTATRPIALHSAPANGRLRGVGTQIGESGGRLRRGALPGVNPACQRRRHYQGSARQPCPRALSSGAPERGGQTNYRFYTQKFTSTALDW